MVFSTRPLERVTVTRCDEERNNERIEKECVKRNKGSKRRMERKELKTGRRQQNGEERKKKKSKAEEKRNMYK